jgi:predicted phage terminase large subunit-like protein
VAIPARMRAASNPGGYGHEWVRLRFIIEGPENGRVFVPASLVDNPHLDQEQYRASLMNLDPVTREQLLAGDWTVRSSGGYFRREWFERPDLILPQMPSLVRRMVRGWDLAASEPRVKGDPDFTAGFLMALGVDEKFWILDIVRMQGTPRDVRDTVKRTAYEDGYACEIVMQQDPGQAGVDQIESYTKELAGFAFKGLRLTGDKVTRAFPLSVQCQAGNVGRIAGLSGWEAFCDEADGFPETAHDDQIDAAALAFIQLALGGELRVARPQVQDMFRWKG